jgi:glutamate-1-semialdehyde 2,1-aminomutase
VRSIARSETLFARARNCIPGGVNSPVRAFRAVGGTPRFIARGEGPYLYDVDGNRYIDYVCSWGALLFGHGFSPVREALLEAMGRGISYGAPTEAEVELAELICRLVPSIEKVRLVNSGTEATMSAVRLARACTGRPHIVKFEGCYHGHADSFLIGAGSGALTLGVPSSPGVTPGAARDTLLAPYNDLEAVEALFAAHGGQIAAVIVEPVAGNMGCVLPRPGFLEGLRRLCDRHGALLIFDEVMTGFRLAPGGAQERYGVIPDLTTLGKILGGGLPIGAYGGRRELMDQVAPEGPVYQAGTLSGNPLAVAAGKAMLGSILADPGLYDRLEEQAGMFEAELRARFARFGEPVWINRAGSMMGIFFSAEPVVDYRSATGSDTRRFARLFHALLHEGVYLPPSPFEAFFLSTAHTEAVLEATLEAVSRALEGQSG